MSTIYEAAQAFREKVEANKEAYEAFLAFAKAIGADEKTLERLLGLPNPAAVCDYMFACWIVEQTRPNSLLNLCDADTNK